MFIKLFLYYQRSTDDYFIIDIYANGYSQGNTAEEAVLYAIDNGVELDDMDLSPELKDSVISILGDESAVEAENQLLSSMDVYFQDEAY